MAKPAAQVEVTAESMNNVCTDVSEKLFHLYVWVCFTYVYIELEWNLGAAALPVTVCLPESVGIITCGEDSTPVVVLWEILAQYGAVRLWWTAGGGSKLQYTYHWW